MEGYCVRYIELNERRPVLSGIYGPQKDHSRHNVNDIRKPPLTLRHLNKLKHIRKNRQRAHDDKMSLVSTMYGDPQLREHEIEAQQQALENLKDEIANQIDAAEIDQKQKSHIETMAMNTIERQRKS
jgi:DNA-binding helix-hairpin-helix protein with protein kinase domain